MAWVCAVYSVRVMHLDCISLHADGIGPLLICFSIYHNLFPRCIVSTVQAQRPRKARACISTLNPLWTFSHFISAFMPSFHARQIHSPTFHRLFSRDRQKIVQMPGLSDISHQTEDHCKIWTQLFAGTFTHKTLRVNISRFNISQVRHLEPLFIWKENMFSFAAAKWQSNPFDPYGYGW